MGLAGCTGGGLLNRIHFPADHNAIIARYCASQHMHTHTSANILLRLGFDFIIPSHCVLFERAQQPDTPIYLFSYFHNQPHQACVILLHTFLHVISQRLKKKKKKSTKGQLNYTCRKMETPR